jgi:hypothetical protein
MSDLLTSHSHCIGATQEKPVHTLAGLIPAFPSPPLQLLILGYWFVKLFEHTRRRRGRVEKLDQLIKSRATWLAKMYFLGEFFGSIFTYKIS